MATTVLISLIIEQVIVIEDGQLWLHVVQASHTNGCLGQSKPIDAERALNLFYTTKVYQQLSDPKYGLQLMSDDYILENLIEELRETQ